MTFGQKLDSYFWIFLVIGVVFGFLFPQFLQQFEGYMLYVFMVMAGILFMKVDIWDLVTHIKQPFLLTYILSIHLLVLPFLTYFIARPFVGQTMLMGLTFLAALPAGISSAAFTDIIKGRTSLTLAIVLLSNFAAIFTIPLVMWVLFKAELTINYANMLRDIFLVFSIPFVASQVLKYVLLRSVVVHIRDYYNVVLLTCVSIMSMVGIALNSEYILANSVAHIPILGILFVTLFGFQIFGYFTLFFLNKGERLAGSAAMMIVNNILGMVIAIAFFDQSILNVVILSFIPWSALIILKHWYKKYLP